LYSIYYLDESFKITITIKYLTPNPKEINTKYPPKNHLKTIKSKITSHLLNSSSPSNENHPSRHKTKLKITSWKQTKWIIDKKIKSIKNERYNP
jgi:hypothetical protein